MELFSTLPNDARVWIYAAPRPFTENEGIQIQQNITQFCTSWTAHEQALRAESAILFNQFVVFVVDENVNQVSGCGIDKSVHFMQEIGRKLNLDFFNRMLIFVYLEPNVIIYTHHTLQQAIDLGEIHSENLVFNHLVNNLGMLKENWIQPIHENWAARRLKFSVQH